MSEQETDEKLQFDKAEFDSEVAEARCSMCNNALSGQYYTVNMSSTCPNCAENARLHFARPATVGATFKSILFGIGAGIAGSVVYYIILKLTGYEIGFIAILVGYLVGRAVMIGSGHRGGLRYRAIAVAITYLAIVSTYVPLVIDGARQAEKNQAALSGNIPAAGGAAPVPITGSNAPAKTPEKAQPELKPAAPLAPLTFGEAVYSLLILAGFMLALPFLAGMENIIGILIIGFAVFEAARRTAKPKLEIFGPFEISARKADA